MPTFYVKTRVEAYPRVTVIFHPKELQLNQTEVQSQKIFFKNISVEFRVLCVYVDIFDYKLHENPIYPDLWSAT